MTEAGKARPLPFSSPMIIRLKEGLKTQTRRILNPQPPAWASKTGPVIGKHCTFEGCHPDGKCGHPKCACTSYGPGMFTVKLKHGEVGDRIWAKETYRLHFINGSDDRGWDVGLEFRADDDGSGVFPPRTVHIDEKPKSGWPGLCKGGHNPWRSPRFMPRWASRILLEVTDIRVERVRDISEEDSMAEGVQSRKIVNDVRMGTQTVWGFGDDNDWAHTAAQAFLHDFAPDDSNPWVWALTFKRVS